MAHDYTKTAKDKTPGGASCGPKRSTLDFIRQFARTCVPVHGFTPAASGSMPMGTIILN